MNTGITTAHSVVEPTPRAKRIAGTLIILYALVTMVPLVWIIATSIKSRLTRSAIPRRSSSSLLSRATATCSPSNRGRRRNTWRNCRQRPASARKLRGRVAWWWPAHRTMSRVSSIRSSSDLDQRSARGARHPAAYAFSRFRIPLADDLMFFILSTRMMPPIAVAIPIYLMFRQLGLSDTKLGMILLYTAVNVSLAVWLLKGFIDEIPREIRGSGDDRRLHPASSVSKNRASAGGDGHCGDRDLLHDLRMERIRLRGFAQPPVKRRPLPPFIPIIIGDEGGQDWPAVAAGTTIFLVPILVFTVLLRKHLLPWHHLRRGAEMSDRSRSRRIFRRPPWSGRDDMICAGVVMLMQPFALVLYTWSFLVTLGGVVLYTIVSRFPD